MANPNPVPTIDSLSKEERTLIVAALKQREASLTRGSKYSFNVKVADAYAEEAVHVRSLIVRFS